MKFQTHWNYVDFMIQILVKEMCNISLHEWKENAIKIVHAKNLKMEFSKTIKIWHIYSLRF